MNLWYVALIWSLSFSSGACQMPSSTNTLQGSLTVMALPFTPAGAFTLARADQVPFTLPTRQPGFRLLMLNYPEAVRGPVFKLTLLEQARGDLTVAYRFKAAPQGKDRSLELFYFDGQEFDLLGRLAGNAVTDAPLDTRPLFTKARTEVYIFGLSFTRAQYRQACSSLGRFNGSYCGPK